MIMQMLNIVAGSLLAAPQLKAWGLEKAVLRWEAWIGRFREQIGTVTLILGVLALIDRIGLVSLPIPEFGASFPQTLPAIGIGLLLAVRLVERYPALQNLVRPLLPHAVWIGLLGLAVGIGSLLFGCFIPQFCRGPWF